MGYTKWGQNVTWNSPGHKWGEFNVPVLVYRSIRKRWDNFFAGRRWEGTVDNP